MLIAAFLMGLVGSVHCIGMCGPLAVVANRLGRNQSALNAIMYNVSRIGVYIFLGVLFGSLGQVVIVNGFQKWLSIVLGSLILLSALLMLIRPQVNNYITGQFGFVFKLLGKFNRPGSSGHRNVFMLGVINGFLPCGLVYMAVAGSLIQTTLINSALYMLIFGLGTLPIMFSLSHSGDKLLSLVRGNYKRILTFGLFCFGIFLLYRGLGMEFSGPVESILDPTQGIVGCE